MLIQCVPFANLIITAHSASGLRNLFTFVTSRLQFRKFMSAGWEQLSDPFGIQEIRTRNPKVKSKGKQVNVAVT
jgi:hypothetical protein